MLETREVAPWSSVTSAADAFTDLTERLLAQGLAEGSIKGEDPRLAAVSSALGLIDHGLAKAVGRTSGQASEADERLHTWASAALDVDLQQGDVQRIRRNGWTTYLRILRWMVRVDSRTARCDVSSSADRSSVTALFLAAVFLLTQALVGMADPGSDRQATAMRWRNELQRDMASTVADLLEQPSDRAEVYR